MRYTEEMSSFLIECISKHPHRETARLFHSRFGIPMTPQQVANWAHRHGIQRNPNRVKWTRPKVAFMLKIIPGHSYDEISEMFCERFGIRLNKSQIQNFKSKHKTLSGTTGGRFEPGHESHNKGKHWEDYLTDDGMEKARKNHFLKGGLPVNTRPIGAERVNRDGYVEVHVSQKCREKRNDQWQMKHRLIWERANGRPVPEGHNIVFADGDKRNFDPDNLVCVSRSDWSAITTRGISFCDRETLENAIAIAQLSRKVYDVRCSKRPCRACGEEFKPRFPHQRTCDACLGRQ